jgi:hypothetical protein
VVAPPGTDSTRKPPLGCREAGWGSRSSWPRAGPWSGARSGCPAAWCSVASIPGPARKYERVVHSVTLQLLETRDSLRAPPAAGSFLVAVRRSDRESRLAPAQTRCTSPGSFAATQNTRKSRTHTDVPKGVRHVEASGHTLASRTGRPMWRAACAHCRDAGRPSAGSGAWAVRPRAAPAKGSAPLRRRRPS